MIEIAVFVAGALWRRALGGWGGDSRVMLVLVGMLFVLPAWIAWLLWPDGGHLGLAVYTSGALPLHFTYGVKFTDWRYLLIRYSALMLPIAVVWGFWPAALVGPICMAVYTELRDRKVPTLPPFIDGWTSYGELIVGGASMLVFVLAPFYLEAPSLD